MPSGKQSSDTHTVLSHSLKSIIFWTLFKSFFPRLHDVPPTLAHSGGLRDESLQQQKGGNNRNGVPFSFFSPLSFRPIAVVALQDRGEGFFGLAFFPRIKGKQEVGGNGTFTTPFFF